MYERVKFTTKDGVIIVGDYYSVEYPAGFVLLLHMMPAVKESWQELAKALNAAKMSCLAIDMRGHGESISKEDGTTLNYNKFSDKEHQQKILDVRAAIDWLKAKGAEESHVAVVGASIGANLALQELAEVEQIKTAVLLSPGLKYRGIATDALAKKLAPSQSFLCVAALDDKHSFDTCREIVSETQAKTENVQLDEAGHGTNMFNSKPELIEKVVAWIKDQIAVRA